MENKELSWVKMFDHQVINSTKTDILSPTGIRYLYKVIFQGVEYFLSYYATSLGDNFKFLCAVDDRINMDMHKVIVNKKGEVISAELLLE